MSSSKLNPYFYLWFTAKRSSVLQLAAISTEKIREKLTGNLRKNNS